MIKLLIDGVEQEIKWIQYLDGQQYCYIEEERFYKKHYRKIEVHVKCKNFLDIEKLICLSKAVDKLRYKTTNKVFFMPYLFGARSDRQFYSISCSYVQDVIMPILTSLECDAIITYDIHNLDILKENIRIINKSIIDKVLQNSKFTKNIISNSIYCFPDKGANDRFGDMICGKVLPRIIGDKTRDENGKITGLNLNYDVDIQGRDIIIIDDICSKGGTFMAVANQLKDKVKSIHLVVSHYEGTADIQALKDAGITSISTTNSYYEGETDEYIHVMDVFNAKSLIDNMQKEPREYYTSINNNE